MRRKRLMSAERTAPRKRTDAIRIWCAARMVPCIQDGEKLVYIPAWVLTQSENNDISEEHGAYDNIVQLVYINAVDGSCVDIIETAKCLETWYGTDPETGAGTKTISK